MKKYKFIIFLLLALTASLSCFAQPEYTTVKNEFCANAETHSRDIQKKDDLSFLLSPLTELKLDDKYILSDFRKYRSLKHKDWSSLRLYVRKRTQQRPDDEYFEKEYLRYLKCQKSNMPYKTDKNQVAFIDPFKEISLTGTKMSIWQAYLLSKSPILFGMRDEANYDKIYLITSIEDVNSIISSIKTTWESNLFTCDFTMDSVKDSKKRRVNETFALVDSLESVKNKELQPIFTYDADSVTIEHYAFAEFHGLIRCRTTLFFTNRRYRHIKKIDVKPFRCIAKYRRDVWY